MSTSVQPLVAARGLIGMPWKPETNCWWLVRTWFAYVLGTPLPDIDVADTSAEHQAEVLRVCTAGGLRHVGQADPQANDIALLRNPGSGQRHVGVLLWANGELSLLHSEGAVDQEATEKAGRLVCTGPGVVCEPLVVALQRYHGLELWRRTC